MPKKRGQPEKLAEEVGFEPGLRSECNSKRRRSRKQALRGKSNLQRPGGEGGCGHVIMRWDRHHLQASVTVQMAPGGQPQLPGTVIKSRGGSPGVWGQESDEAAFRAYCCSEEWMAGEAD